MGLFDYVTIKSPMMPEAWRSIPFQTKDLECYMHRYVITEDGKLTADTEGIEGLQANFTATVELDWSNVVASGPGIYTRDGEDAEFIECEAVFIDGLLSELRQIRYSTKPALASSEHRITYKPLSAEEKRQLEERQAESLLGREMCVWWGGQDSGYMAKVIAETKREIVLEHDGRIDTIDRSARDRLLFDSYEEGKAHKEARERDWAEKKADYERKIDEKMAARTCMTVVHKIAAPFSIYLEGIEMRCPFCQTLIRSGEEHRCEISSSEDPKKRDGLSPGDPSGC